MNVLGRLHSLKENSYFSNGSTIEKEANVLLVDNLIKSKSTWDHATSNNDVTINADTLILVADSNEMMDLIEEYKENMKEESDDGG